MSLEFVTSLLNRTFGFMRHVSDADALRYGRADLSIDQASEFEEHYCVCDECATRLVIAFQSRLVPAAEAASVNDARTLEASMRAYYTTSDVIPASKWRFSRPSFAPSVIVAATVMLTSALLMLRPIDLRIHQINERGALEPPDVDATVAPLAVHMPQGPRREKARRRPSPSILNEQVRTLPATRRFVPPAYTYWRVPEPAMLADTRLHGIPLALREPIRFNDIPQLPPPTRSRIHRAFIHITKALGWVARR